MKVSAVAFACYSSACRPPTSGGTGGSSSKGGASVSNYKLTKGADGRYRMSTFTASKVPGSSKYRVVNEDGKLIATVKGLKGVERRITKEIASRPKVSLRDTQAKKQQDSVAPKEQQNPGTPGWTPRKLSKSQAESEMDSIIRDGENEEGPGPDPVEARAFLSAFKEMRSTGKEVTKAYDNGDREVTVHPGDTEWFTKLDYETYFPADTVAAWLGEPLA